MLILGNHPLSYELITNMILDSDVRTRETRSGHGQCHITFHLTSYFTRNGITKNQVLINASFDKLPVA
jgi:hypothetical protein